MFTRKSAPLLALVLLVLAAAPARAEVTPLQIVQLLDYLGRDYGAAVQDGKVISDFEYNEQLEFAQTVADGAAAEPKLADTALQAGIAELKAKIDAKVPSAEIAALTQKLRAEVIARTGLPTAPTAWPDLANGRRIYAEQCASCHGVDGKGDGPAAKGMEPPAASFVDPARMNALTPFQAFTTTRSGVQGTGMAAFANLSEKETWDTAFYLFALRHPDASHAGLRSEVLNQDLPSLAQLASSGDEALAANLTGDAGEVAQLLAALRTDPQRVVAAQTRLTTARARLEDAWEAYTHGDKGGAERLALLSYLDGIEPFEVRLAARDNKIVPRIEEAMIGMRAAVKDGLPPEQAQAAFDHARRVIADAEAVLGGKAMSYAVTLTTSFLIMLREGFEAVLIVVALFAVLRKLKADKARRWTHLGWISALLAGVATWLVSESLLEISGAQREILEGVVGLVAVAVLIYMGIWLHNQAEMRKWAAFVNEKARAALAEKRYYTFFGLSFLAVYREAFETVLFYRALALDTTPDTESALLVGLLIGIAAIAALAYAMLKIGARIPLQRFFQISAGLIFALTVVLLGKGLHAFQEAGWVSINPFPVNLRIDLLGVYPTWETMASQIALIVFLLLLRRKLTTTVPRNREAASHG